MIEAKEDKKRQTFRSSHYKAFFFSDFLVTMSKVTSSVHKATIYFFQKTLDQRLKGAEILVYWTSTREYN